MSWGIGGGGNGDHVKRKKIHKGRNDDDNNKATKCRKKI
jgi:hypothetical protein